MRNLLHIAAVWICFVQVAFMAQASDQLQLTETDTTIEVTQRGKPVLQYNKSARPVPKGIGKQFRRSGYIHPVCTPTGQELTGDYPADHAHQHALFFAWTKCRYDGQPIDFWNQAKGLGKIEFREVMDLKREKQSVSFAVKHVFQVKVNAKDADAWIDVLHEVWKVTVHATPSDHFLFDIVSTQRCVADKPLHLEEYHYGGMAIRGNAQWLGGKGDENAGPVGFQFITSDGKDRFEGNHTRPNWVALSGQIDGHDVTAAVFGSPKNFRAPQHVRIHPSKPYFCFAPMVDGPFTIAPGKDYVSRYRYFVTSQPHTPKLINKHWQRYAGLGK